MRRIAFVTFAITTVLAVGTGAVLAFGASQALSGPAATGDAAVSVSAYQPVLVNGIAVALDDQGQPQAVATASITNISGGQGQPEAVAGTVSAITAVAPSQPSQGDTAACNSFINGGGVTGTVRFLSPTGYDAQSAVLSPPSTGTAASTSLQVALTMQPNPLDTYGASVCSDQQLTFDVLVTSALPN